MRYLLVTAIFFFATNIIHAQNLIRFYENYKVGYKDDNGKTIVPAIYQAGSEFEDGLALVVFNNHRGFIDFTGKEVINLIYDDAAMFDEQGLAAVKYAGKYGYINKKGEWKISPFYENAFPFHNGLARVMKNGKYGFINTEGEFIIPAIYSHANDFSEDLAAVNTDSHKIMYIDKKNKIAIKKEFLSAGPFLNGKAIVNDDYEFIIIDKNGKKIKEAPMYEEHKEALENYKKHKLLKK